MNERRFPLCLLLAAIFIFLQGCFSSSETGQVGTVVRSTGEKLYIAKCGGCHELYAPEKYKKDEWKKWLKAMQVRSKVTDYENDVIKEYLDSHAKDSFHP